MRQVVESTLCVMSRTPKIVDCVLTIAAATVSRECLSLIMVRNLLVMFSKSLQSASNPPKVHACLPSASEQNWAHKQRYQALPSFLYQRPPWLGQEFTVLSFSATFAQNWPIRLSPFELLYGYQPDNPIDIQLIQNYTYNASRNKSRAGPTKTKLAQNIYKLEMSLKDANDQPDTLRHSRRHVHYSIGILSIQGYRRSRAIASEASSLFPAYEGPYRVSGFKRNRVLEWVTPYPESTVSPRMCRPSRNIFRRTSDSHVGLRISLWRPPSPLATKDQPPSASWKEACRPKKTDQVRTPHRVALVRHCGPFSDSWRTN